MQSFEANWKFVMKNYNCGGRVIHISHYIDKNKNIGNNLYWVLFLVALQFDLILKEVNCHFIDA